MEGHLSPLRGTQEVFAALEYMFEGQSRVLITVYYNRGTRGTVSRCAPVSRISRPYPHRPAPSPVPARFTATRADPYECIFHVRATMPLPLRKKPTPCLTIVPCPPPSSRRRKRQVLTRQISHFLSMHRCLAIPEIVCLICEALSPKTKGEKCPDLARFARTCKSISTVAIRYIWRACPDLAIMIKHTTPADLWTGRELVSRLLVLAVECH